MNDGLVTRRFEDVDASELTVLLHAAYAELSASMVGTLTISLPPEAALRESTPAARTADRAWLAQVAVHPAHRGRGIAAHLWREGRRWARRQGATFIGVDTAIPAGHLLRLYEAWGFTRVDTIHWPGKTYDSATMARPLRGLGRLNPPVRLRRRRRTGPSSGPCRRRRRSSGR